MTGEWKGLVIVVAPRKDVARAGCPSTSVRTCPDAPSPPPTVALGGECYSPDFIQVGTEVQRG